MQGVAACIEGMYNIFKKCYVGRETFPRIGCLSGSNVVGDACLRSDEEFPIEERYSLIDQIRRSSRSICANLAEAWRRRRYQAAFVAKLNEAEAEAAETQVHVEIALRHNYLRQEVYEELDDACDKILAQIVKMIEHSEIWVIKPPNSSSRA
jgi:four helix bundle protein